MNDHESIDFFGVLLWIQLHRLKRRRGVGVCLVAQPPSETTRTNAKTVAKIRLFIFTLLSMVVVHPLKCETVSYGFEQN